MLAIGKLYDTKPSLNEQSGSIFQDDLIDGHKSSLR